MGMFKDLRSTMAAGKDAAEAAQAMAQAQQQALQAQVDPNDPMWAPIEGIDCDTYARISAGLLKDGVAGIEAVNAYAESHGVPPGRWNEVQQGWTHRMAQHMPVRTRFGTLYSQLSS